MTQSEVNRNIRLSRIAEEYGVTYGMIHEIIIEQLQYRKFCARQIPHTLSDQQKKRAFHIQSAVFRTLHKTGNAFLDKIITRDETWIHCYTPLSEQGSLLWKYCDSSRSTKVHCKIPARMITASFFFNKDGLLLIEFFEPSKTINAAHYCYIL